MTEFEMEVAKALKSQFEYRGIGDEILADLAPLVAAAIEGAVREAASWDPEPREYQDALQAALAALRGETP